jgi:L-alanine-DL-glutamate epimerase-like enolase superfamily enzyme
VKITGVESLVMFGQYHFVRVHTDEGITGLGEIGSRETATTDPLVRKGLAPLLLGRSPFDIERLWHEMLHKGYKLGPSGGLLEAMAGIDIALWDIVGKAAGLPLYDLLGGRYRTELKVYASSNRRDLSPEEEAERAASFRDEGYDAYKIHSFVRWQYDDGLQQSRDHTVATVRAIRDRVGDDFDILVDVTNAYHPHTALRVARELEELKAWHLEEPIVDYDLAGYAQLAAAADIAIAAGENCYTRWQFRDLILIGQVDIIQPDVIKCGGISEFRKIAALAQTFNKPITVHNTQPTVGTVAHMHLWANISSCVYPQEYSIEPHPLRDEWPILDEPPVVRAGAIELTSRPGLGVNLDDAVVRRLVELGHAVATTATGD